MHDLTIAAACRVTASIHAQHQTMMMMIKSNGTSNVPDYVKGKKIANHKDGLGQLVFFCRKHKDNY
jgi:hypothetical protein